MDDKVVLMRDYERRRRTEDADQPKSCEADVVVLPMIREPKAKEFMPKPSWTL